MRANRSQGVWDFFWETILMAYTTAQLVTAYTNANLGKAPDAATTLTLDAYATQSQTGGISDTTALANTLKLVNSTTAVAIQTYQFFTGAAPSAAGLDYLVDSTTNTNDLNDAYYAKFAQENRFINFSINLATGAGAGAAAFAAAYTGVSYQQTVATAYDKIIGNAVATAAGVDVAAAVAYLSRQANIDYLTAFVKSATGLTAQADIELAVKAALIGTILNAATVSGLGGYATATAAMINDLSDGTLSTDNSAGVNIFTAYPSSGIAGSVFALTTGVDTPAATANNDTFNATNTTFTNLDAIDGGAGVDTLNIVDVAGTFSTASALSATVKNVENVNVTSVGTLTANTTAWTGVTALTTTSVGGATVTGAGTTAITATDGTLAAGTLTINGGSTVSATTATTSTGDITIGATTASTGAVTVKASVAGTGALTQGAIAVKGGTSVNVTTTATQATVNTTTTQAAVTVTGTSITKDVTVTQSSKVTASGTAKGIGLGDVTVNDVNATSATKAGTITSVTLTNAGTVSIGNNSLANLSLTGTVGAVTVTANATAITDGIAATSLALNLGKGTTTSITANQYKTINANVTGAATVTTLTDTAATALNVSGSAALTIGTATLAALTSATVTGSAGLTADLSAITTLAKVDTTGTTGTSSITVDATKGVTVAGGAGADTITLAGALKSGTSITLGAGNDRLLGTTAVTTSTTSVVDGGDGTDTVASTLINAGNGSMFKNFEVLGLGSNTLDAALLTGSTVTSLELTTGGGTGTFSNVTAAQSLKVTGTAAAGTTTLSFTGVSGSADAYAISFAGVGSSDETAPTAVNARTVSIAGIETVTIDSGSASGFTANTIVLTDAAARTLTVTGAQDIDVSFATAFGTAGTNGLSKIDASAVTGDVTLNTTNAGIATAGLTVSTGSGDDSVTLASAATVSTGAGDDIIVLGGASTVDAGTGDDQITTSAAGSTITLGGGDDKVTVAATVAASTTAPTITTITDAFGAGDSLVFANQGTEAFTSAKADVSAATTLVDALNIAITAAGDTNGQIYWFQYGGNTYVVEHLGASTNLDTADVVVKLAGLVDLSTASYTAGTNTLAL